MRRPALACFCLTVTLAGCAGAAAPVTPRPPLGVQTNEVPFTPLTLRVRPPPGASFMTGLELEARAELLGRELTLDHRLVQAREIIERRPDGTTVLAQRTVSGGTEISMGEGPPRTESISPDASAQSFVMDERGRTIEDALFGAPEATGGRRETLRRIFDPLLDALAYPTEALALGQSWSSRDSHELREGDASGRLEHQVVQTLVRVEGTGSSALAVISLRGEVRGDGTIEGDPTSGSVRVEGVYTVSTEDGLVRGMELRLSGNVSLGGLAVPVEGTLRYRAEPSR